MNKFYREYPMGGENQVTADLHVTGSEARVRKFLELFDAAIREVHQAILDDPTTIGEPPRKAKKKPCGCRDHDVL